LTILDDFAEIMIGLGANEAVGVHRGGIACPRLRLSSVDNSQRRQGVDDEPVFMFCSPFVFSSSGLGQYR
jgi:hypothetical protein